MPSDADASPSEPVQPAERRPSARASFGIGTGAGLAYGVLTLLALPLAGASFDAVDSPPASPAWFLGLLAPLPIAWLGWTARRRWLAGLGVAIGSLPLWVAHHAWVSSVSFAGVFPLIAYLAVWPGLAAVGISLARRRCGSIGPAVVVPTVWVALEFLRGEILFGGYAWFLAGHPAIEFLPLARAAAAGGVPLVSWLVVAIGAVALAARYGSRSARRIGWAVSAVVIAAMLSGWFRGSPESTRTVRIAAIQTNVPQNNKQFPSPEQVAADFADLLRLAERAAAEGAELLVTPETVFPGLALDQDGADRAAGIYGDSINAYRDILLGSHREHGVPMLIGSLTRTGLEAVETEPGVRTIEWDRILNSVYLLEGGGVMPVRYDKLRPMAFGETLPYIDAVPWLRDVVLRIGIGASGMDFGLDRGTDRVVFGTPAGVVAAPICFESSMAPVVRGLLSAGTDAGTPVELMVVMTNDGWFGRFDAGRAMHLLQARWRCLETGLPMVRCANTGLSAIVERDGSVAASLPARSEGVLLGEVGVGAAMTVYRRVGDAFGWICLLLGAAAVGSGVGRRRAARVSGSAGGV
ncbi:MAG: apolipoprotein N-acyltransferase [Planctomycetota bacterium]